MLSDDETRQLCCADFRIEASARCAGLMTDILRLLAAQQMPARHEQIGERAGYQQAMFVLLEPAIAHLGKAEHPLDDRDRLFDPGPDLRLGSIFRPLDLVL